MPPFPVGATACSRLHSNGSAPQLAALTCFFVCQQNVTCVCSRGSSSAQNNWATATLILAKRPELFYSCRPMKQSYVCDAMAHGASSMPWRGMQSKSRFGRSFSRSIKTRATSKYAQLYLTRRHASVLMLVRVMSWGPTFPSTQSQFDPQVELFVLRTKIHLSCHET